MCSAGWHGAGLIPLKPLTLNPGSLEVSPPVYSHSLLFLQVSGLHPSELVPIPRVLGTSGNLGPGGSACCFEQPGVMMHVLCCRDSLQWLRSWASGVRCNPCALGGRIRGGRPPCNRATALSCGGRHLITRGACVPDGHCWALAGAEAVLMGSAFGTPPVPPAPCCHAKPYKI